jgi:hypothetical protein
MRPSLGERRRTGYDLPTMKRYWHSYWRTLNAASDRIPIAVAFAVGWVLAVLLNLAVGERPAHAVISASFIAAGTAVGVALNRRRARAKRPG